MLIPSHQVLMKKAGITVCKSIISLKLEKVIASCEIMSRVHSDGWIQYEYNMFTQTLNLWRVMSLVTCTTEMNKAMPHPEFKTHLVHIQPAPKQFCRFSYYDAHQMYIR